ncbi:MAG: hypothetical protein JO138_11145 [Acidobacteriaceae bacterium]|nr:hypothetical protein [Acidobacteriaceae bacterium]
MRHLLYLLAGLIVFLGVCAVSSAMPEDEALVRRIDETVFDREAHLQSYSDIEHYTLRNSRLKKVSEMIVRVVYQKNAGKSFDVISEAGPSIVLGRVFKSSWPMSNAGVGAAKTKAWSSQKTTRCGWLVKQ